MRPAYGAALWGALLGLLAGMALALPVGNISFLLFGRGGTEDRALLSIVLGRALCLFLGPVVGLPLALRRAGALSVAVTGRTYAVLAALAMVASSPFTPWAQPLYAEAGPGVPPPLLLYAGLALASAYLARLVVVRRGGASAMADEGKPPKNDMNI
jgi:hypothetical protein